MLSLQHQLPVTGLNSIPRTDCTEKPSVEEEVGAGEERGGIAGGGGGGVGAEGGEGVTESLRFGRIGKRHQFYTHFQH